MKNNLVKRLLTCVIGIPFVASLIFLFPQYNFAGFCVLVFLFGLFGSFEISTMVFGKKTVLSYLSSLLIVFSYFLPDYTELFLALFVIGILLNEIKAGEIDSFATSVTNISKKLLTVIYPSYLVTFVIRFIQCENTNAYALLLFFLLVFANDIFAYVFGMLFGRNNAGILKASPKKSIAGFIGGTAACVAIGLVYFKIFGSELFVKSQAVKILLCLFTSVLANIGDLAESVIKRCSNTKDSGTLIPGRGGVLDCIDSIITAAPLFYLVFSL